MPELPEVERARGLVERLGAGRRVVRVRCAADPIVLPGLPPRRLERAMRGRRIESVHRRGKHLWLLLDEGPHPLFHLGMTGAFHAPGVRPLELATGPRPAHETWPPRYAKVVLELDDGGRLAFADARRFARVRLRADPAREPPVGDLGFDPLLDLPPLSVLAAALARRRGPVKSVLLDQRLLAGVGNWIADEVLYQAGIDPRRPASSLDRAEVGRLRARLRHVVRTAVAADADSDRYPRGWLFHRRWGRATGMRTPRGEAIEHLTIGGRTTAWVPARQR